MASEASFFTQDDMLQPSFPQLAPDFNVATSKESRHNLKRDAVLGAVFGTMGKTVPGSGILPVLIQCCMQSCKVVKLMGASSTCHNIKCDSITLQLL